LYPEDLPPGRHLTALGADEPGKQELAPEVLLSARLIVDDAALVATHGALANAGLPASTAAASLGAVIRGEAIARSHHRELTVYAPVGMPWQDLALSWSAFRRADAAGTGATLDLLS